MVVTDWRPPTDDFEIDGDDARSEPEHKADHLELHRRNKLTYLMPPPTGSAATDTEMLEEALAITLERAQANGLYGGTIELDAGRYRFRAVELRGRIRTRIKGVYGETTWTYEDEADRHALTVVNSAWCQVSDVVMDMGDGAASAIRCLRDAGAGFAPTQNQFIDLEINGRNTTPAALMIGGAGMVDANDDYTKYQNVQAYGYTDSALEMHGINAYGNAVIDCWFDGGTGAQYGVKSFGAGLFWKRGRMTRHGDADFYFNQYGGSGYQPITIEELNNRYMSLGIDEFLSEASARLMRIAAGHRIHVLMRGGRWAGNQAAEDNRIIIAEGGVRAMVHMLGVNLGDGSPTPRPYEIDFSQANANSRLWYAASDIFSTADPIFTGITPTAIQGVGVYTDESTATYHMLSPEV